MSRNAARSNKRAGDTLVAPNTKKANKENAELASQRRSGRDRSQQITPRQRMEDISSIISGDTRLGKILQSNAESDVLGDVNPMAPEEKRRGRPSNRGRKQSACTPTRAIPTPPPATLSIPSIDMQQFATMATGLNYPQGDYRYNLALPTSQAASSSAASSSTPQSGNSLVESIGTILDSLDDSNGYNQRDSYGQSSTSLLPPQYYAAGTQSSGNMEYGANGQSYGALGEGINTLGNESVMYDSNYVNYNPGMSSAEAQDRLFMECTFPEGLPAVQTQQGPVMRPVASNIQGALDGRANDEGVLSDGGDNSSVGSAEREEDEIRSSDGEEGQDYGKYIGEGRFGVGLSNTESTLANALGPNTKVSAATGESSGSNVNRVSSVNRPSSVNKPAVTPVVTSQPEHFVLDAHYKRNRHPRPPTINSDTSQNRSTQLRSASTSRGNGNWSSVGASGASSSTALGSTPAPTTSAASTAHSHSSGRSGFNQEGNTAQSGRNRDSSPEDDSTGTTGNFTDQGEGTSRTRAPRRAAKVDKVIEPDKLEFYPTNWQAVLKLAKLYLRLWIATQVPFPDKAVHYEKTLEFLTRALNEHQAKGGYVEEGYFENHRSGMQKLIWDDIATFRGEIKNLARECIKFYNFQPVTAESKEAYRATIVQNIQELLVNTFFLRDGFDENGRPRNFCHPNLRRLVLSAFYANTSKLGSRFPDQFRYEVPRQALALAATAMYCALKEWEGGAHKNSNFNRESYGGRHVRMLNLIAELENDDYHSERIQAVRQQWAQMGSMQTADGDDELDLGFAVAL